MSYEGTISELIIVVTVLNVSLINVVWNKSINYTILIHLHIYNIYIYIYIS